MAPLVLTEVGAHENLGLRMMTSFVRHHTVISRPIVGYLHHGKLLNGDEVVAELQRAAAAGARLLAGRLVSTSLRLSATQYHPVGYVLATEKDKEMSTMSAREKAVATRYAQQVEEARIRLADVVDAKAHAQPVRSCWRHISCLHPPANVFDEH